VRILLAVLKTWRRACATCGRGVTVREFAEKFPGKVLDLRALSIRDPNHGHGGACANPDANLLSGMYVEVALTLASPHKVLEFRRPFSTTTRKVFASLWSVAMTSSTWFRHDRAGYRRDSANIDGIQSSDRIVKLAKPRSSKERSSEVAH